MKLRIHHARVPGPRLGDAEAADVIRDGSATHFPNESPARNPPFTMIISERAPTRSRAGIALATRLSELLNSLRPGMLSQDESASRTTTGPFSNSPLANDHRSLVGVQKKSIVVGSVIRPSPRALLLRQASRLQPTDGPRGLVWACPRAQRARMLCPLGQIPEAFKVTCDIKISRFSEIYVDCCTESNRS
jgi:hypothetical protein